MGWIARPAQFFSYYNSLSAAIHLYMIRPPGWWNGTDPFNWMEVIGEANQLPSSKLTTPNERYCAGKKLLEIHSDKSKFLLFTSKDLFDLVTGDTIRRIDIVSRCFENKNDNCCETKISKISKMPFVYYLQIYESISVQCQFDGL